MAGPGHGKDVAFAMDDSAATLRNIGGFVRDVNFSRDGQTIDITGMDGSATGSWRAFLAGLRGAECTISGIWDDTPAAADPSPSGPAVVIPPAHLLEGTIEYGPLGRVATQPKMSAEAILESFNVQAGVEDAVTFSATFRINGAVTDGVYS